MGCFVVPLTQAIVTSAVRYNCKKSGKDKSANPWLRKLGQLELMLWGGSAMLVVDHILNGEVTWQYPFFTALAQEGGVATLLDEMLTVGVPMSVLVTLIYAVMVAVSGKQVPDHSTLKV